LNLKITQLQVQSALQKFAYLRLAEHLAVVLEPVGNLFAILACQKLSDFPKLPHALVSIDSTLAPLSLNEIARLLADFLEQQAAQQAYLLREHFSFYCLFKFIGNHCNKLLKGGFT
jgi:hypothetical protein